MKIKNLLTTLTLVAIFLIVGKVGWGQTTYTWNVASGDWSTATNWTPNGTPTSIDYVVFDGSTFASATVTNIPNQVTVAKFNIINNASVTFSSGTEFTCTGTITRTTTAVVGTGTLFTSELSVGDIIQNGTNLYNVAAITDDTHLTTVESGNISTSVSIKRMQKVVIASLLSIESGSLLNISSTTPISLVLSTGATGSVSGSVACTGAIHRILPVDANSLTFNNGSTLTQGTGCNGNIFYNSGTANVVVFASGSKFISIAGANPFGLSAPNSRVNFQEGSLYSHQQSGAPSFGGRTYPDFEYNYSGTFNSTGGYVDNFILTDGTVNITSATQGFIIKKNLTIASGKSFTFSPSTANTVSAIIFAGTGTQTIINNGTLVLGANSNLVVMPSATFQLNADYDFSGALRVMGTYDATNKVLSGAGSISSDEVSITTITGTTTANSTSITAASSLVGVEAGMFITGTNIPAGTYVTGITGTTTIYISQPATGAGTATALTLTRTAGTIKSAHANGLNGNITLSGTKTFHANSSFVFNGTVDQVTGSLLPATIKNLTISSSNYLTLSAPVEVSNSLTLTSGAINTSATNTLTVTNPSPTAVVRTAGYVNGPLDRAVAGTVAGTDDFLFPISDYPQGYQTFMAITDVADGTNAIIRAECFSGGATTFTGVLTKIYPRNWKLTNVNAGSFTSAKFTLYESGLNAGNKNLVASSANQSGDYSSIGGTIVSNTITSDAQASLPAYLAVATNSSITSDIVAAGSEVVNIDYTSKTAASIAVTTDGLKVWSFTVRDGGASAPDADANPTKINLMAIVAGANNTADWASTIKRAALFDGTTLVKEIGVNDVSMFFDLSSTPFTIDDNTSKTLDLYVTFETTGIVDNSVLQFQISKANVLAGVGSDFATFDAISSVAANANKIPITASKFNFNQQPPAAIAVHTAMTVKVEAVDANDNRDLDYTSDIKMTTDATFESSTEVVAPVAGLATFDNLKFASMANGKTVTAQKNADNTWAITSNTFDITATPSTVITSDGPAAGNAKVGTSPILYVVKLDNSDAPTQLTSLTLATAGDYTLTDVVNFKLYSNTVNNLTGTPVQLGSTIASAATGTDLVFGSLTENIPIGVTYLIVTGDVAANAVVGKTINIAALSTSNILLTGSTKTGTPVAGGLKTIVNIPTVTIAAAITSLGDVTATWAGEATVTGGEAITEKGICWSTTTNPTIDDVADFKTTEGAGLGVIAGSMTGLTANTAYFVRAYATNSVGTAYSATEKTFRTYSAEPTNHVTAFAAAASTTNLVLTWANNNGTVAPTHYLIKASTLDNVSDPVDGTAVPTDNLVIGDNAGVKVVDATETTFTWTGLTAGTQYFFKIYPFTKNDVDNLPNYKTTTAPAANATVNSNLKVITATTIGTLGATSITNIPAGTTVAALKAAITVSPNATKDILISAGGASAGDADLIANTMVVKVTAQDETTNNYTLALLVVTQNFFEGFTYAAGQYIGGNGNAGSVSNNWTTHSVTAGQTTTIDVIAGNLEYTGLLASTGNKVLLPAANSTVSRDINTPLSIAGDVAYYSALINVVDNTQLSASSADYFMSFGATAGSNVPGLGARLGIKSANSGANYRLAICNTSGTGSNYTDLVQDLNFGTTYLVVVKYNKTAGGNTRADLWVNPSVLGGAEPAGNVFNSSSASAFEAFASICLRNGSGTPKVHIDEIRVGTTFAEVTPLGTTDPTTSVSVATLPDFGSMVINTSSPEASFTVSGSNLTNNVVVTAPAGFEISTVTGAGFTNTNPITLAPTAGSVNSPIYVKFRPTAAQAYTGNITVVSTGVATDKAVAVTGTGVTSDTEAPVFATDYPKAANIGVDKFDVVVKVNELGKVWFLTLASGATAPTVAEVKAGTLISVTAANTDFSSPVTGLTSNTSYDVYFVTEDNQATPNTLAAPVKLTVTTVAVPFKKIYDIQYSTATPADSPLKGQKVITKGLVVAAKTTTSTSFYLQDGVGAWNGIYVYGSTTPVAVGDSVQFTSVVDEYNGLTELKTITNLTILNSGNAIAAAPVVSLADAGSEAYEGVLVKVVNAECTVLPNTYKEWTVSDGTSTLLVNDFLYEYTPTQGTRYNIIGVIDYANSAFKLNPRSASDVTLTTSTPETPFASFRVYPNPFVNEIRFEGANVERVVITSIIGQVVMDKSVQGENFINTNELVRGIYLVKFSNNKGESVLRKLIKE